MIQYPFLVVAQEEYSDPTGILDNPDGEFGGEGYIELDQKEVVLGTYYAQSEEAAISQAASDYGVSVDVLTAYKLSQPDMSPLTLAIVTEIKYLVEEVDAEEDYVKDNKHILEDYTVSMAESMTDAFENFTDDIREMVKQELKSGNYN